MQGRLALSAALIHRPEVLFLDELTAGIDPVLRCKIRDRSEAHRDDGCTLFVTTQYVSEAAYCDRVAVLADGRIIAEDTPGAAATSAGRRRVHDPGRSACGRYASGRGDDLPRSVMSLSALVRKATVDCIRQPVLLPALVVGPFLLLLAFGAGLRDTDPQLRTLSVAQRKIVGRAS